MASWASESEGLVTGLVGRMAGEKARKVRARCKKARRTVGLRLGE